MQLKQKPYNLLLLTAFFIFIISFLPNDSNSTFDLHFHDTYLIIANTHILWFLAFILVALWTIYFISKTIIVSAILTWVHVITTIVPIIFIVFPGYFPFKRRYYDYTQWETFTSFSQYEFLLNIMIIAFIIGQMLFIINLVWGLIKLVVSLIK